MVDPLRTEEFRQRVRFLRESETWSVDRLAAYQLDQLLRIIRHVYDKVPFYRDIMNQKGLHWSDFREIGDLTLLPLLDKATIQSQYEAFVPDGVDMDSLYHRTTGGSTGTPLTVYMDLIHLSRDKANTEYYMNVAGLNIFDYRSVRLYGDRIPQELLDAGKYWYVADGRRLVMSCYHISRDTASQYVRKLDEFRPKYIHSRPSAIYPLAKVMVEQGLSLNVEIDGVFLDGEILPESQRDMLESVFGCRVYLVYGHTEGCAVGFSCDHSRLLHFMPQVGILELLREDGSNVTDEGEKGEMVVTGFNNFMFPLIRYRTGDVGVWTKETCPCGRAYTMLVRVEGRTQDYAVNRLGELVPVAPALFNYNDADWKGIRQFQTRQERPGELIIQIVREPETSEPHESMRTRLLNDINRIFGNAFDARVEFVDDIPRTRIGKFRYFVQTLDLDQTRQVEAVQ